MDTNYKERLSGVFPPCMAIFDENEEVAYRKVFQGTLFIILLFL